MKKARVTATELKNRLGRYLDDSATKDIIVVKSGRPKAVLISKERYDQLVAISDKQAE